MQQNDNDLEEEFSKKLEFLKQETIKNLISISERDKKDRIKELSEELTKIK